MIILREKHNNNTSGTNGVSFDKKNKDCVLYGIKTENNKKTNFTIKKYDGDEKTKQEAIKYRKTMNEITGSTNGDR